MSVGGLVGGCVGGWVKVPGSGSGVEQNFSKGAWGFNVRQLKSDLSHERNSPRVLLYAHLLG